MTTHDDRQLEHHDHIVSGIKYPLVILLDGVSDPVNIGGIFRLADALGVERLMLCGKTVAPPDRRLARCSRSTHRIVPFQQWDDSLAAVERVREEGYRLIALELTQQSIDLKSVELQHDDRVCLLVGAERRGISNELLEIVDQTVHIPMLGQNSSMNVTSACAIAVYEITRRLRS